MVSSRSATSESSVLPVSACRSACISGVIALSGTPRISTFSTMYLVLMSGCRFRIAHARDDEDDARTAVGVGGDPHGRDVARLLGFEARGQLSELLPIERAAVQLADVFLQARTEPREVEARHLCRRDPGSVGRGGFLGVRQRRRKQQECDDDVAGEEPHADTGSQETGHRLSC